MHSGELLPRVGIDATISQALLEVSRKGLGMTAVVDGNGLLAGLFTDGDLRRILDQQNRYPSHPHQPCDDGQLCYRRSRR